MAAVTPELDAGGAHEYRRHCACGAEQQGWPDTGRDYTSAEWVIFHSDERVYGAVSLEEKGSRRVVQTPSCPTASGKPLGDLVRCFPILVKWGFELGRNILRLIVGFCFSHLKLPGAELPGVGNREIA